MIRTFVLFLLLISAHRADAQHIQYKEKEKTPPKQVAAKVVEAPPKDTLVAEIVTPSTDCPGMDASLPVLMNYIPAEILAKLKAKLNNHIYSIASIKVSDTETQYKMKVCNNGVFVIRYADTNGVIVK